MGKENLWPHIKSWAFERFSYNQLPIELVQLMASGIYQFWKFWIRDRPYIVSQLKEEANASPERLSLTSNLSFVFVVLIIGLLTSLTAFITESLNNELKKYNLSDMLGTGIRCSVNFTISLVHLPILGFELMRQRLG